MTATLVTELARKDRASIQRTIEMPKWVTPSTQTTRTAAGKAAPRPPSLAPMLRTTCLPLLPRMKRTMKTDW